MATYYASNDSLLKNYWKTIGEALARGIKVYCDKETAPDYPRLWGELRAMGDLSIEVWQHDNPGDTYYGERRPVRINYFRSN